MFMADWPKKCKNTEGGQVSFRFDILDITYRVILAAGFCPHLSSANRP